MRGIVLAGGKGTRLGELTKVTNKHLLPVGKCPMIYHPLKKLIGAGIHDIMLVSGTEHMGDFIELLGSGRSLGCNLTYRVQDEAGGIAQALSLCEEFVGNQDCVVLLGDNIFYDTLTSVIEYRQVKLITTHAWIAIKKVPDPQRYGVANFIFDCLEFIEEKPAQTKGYHAVTGIYVYPPDVFSFIKTLKPSSRGELEITDVNNHYIGYLGAETKTCNRCRMGWTELQGYWTDAGTQESWQLANILVAENPPKY